MKKLLFAGFIILLLAYFGFLREDVEQKVWDTTDKVVNIVNLDGKNLKEISLTGLTEAFDATVSKISNLDQKEIKVENDNYEIYLNRYDNIIKINLFNEEYKIEVEKAIKELTGATVDLKRGISEFIIVEE